MQTKLLIVAAGKGTRNQSFTLNGALPKILLSTGSETMLEKIIGSYRLAPIDEIVIVCTSTGVIAISDFMKLKMPETKVTYHIDDSFSGTTPTVLKALKECSEDNDSWYINWSDVFATFQPVHETTIFTDSIRRHRNNAFINQSRDLEIESTEGLQGNVAGIYYIHRTSMDYIMETVNSTDLTKLPNDFDGFLAWFDERISIIEIKVHELTDVTDIGDTEKHIEYLSKDQGSEVKSRYFNKVQMGENLVYKSPRSEDGIKLAEIELNYYRRLPANNIFPRLMDYIPETKTMVIEKVKGLTVNEFLTDIKSTAVSTTTVYEITNGVIRKFTQACDTLSYLTNEIYDKNELPDNSQRVSALLMELHVGLRNRVEPILSTINHVINVHDLVSINGELITRSWEMILAKVEKYIANYFGKFEFTLCHGDTNTDNVMFDKETGDLKFIDPRGYFGGLDLLGIAPRYYDLAKFIYGITGYSEFNSCTFVTTQIDEQDIVTVINNKFGFPGILTLDEIEIQDEIKFLVGIIWMRLSTYISNDPTKSVLAYLHGNAIVTKYYKQLGLDQI